MIQAVANRDTLTQYLADLDPGVLQPALVNRLRKGEVLLAFDGEPRKGNLPDRIVVPDAELDDFFAWIGTYVDALSPISSFTEVLSASENDAVTEPRRLNDALQRMLIAAIIVDAGITGARVRGKPGTISLAAGLRTMSAVVAQAVFAGLPREELAQALGIWTQLYITLVPSRASTTPFEATLGFWGDVLPLFGLPQTTADARLLRINEAFIINGSTSYQAWADVSENFVNAPHLAEVMRGPRESRIEAFDRLLKTFANDERVSALDCAFLGYVASMLAEGTLQLWQLVYERSSSLPLPTLPLWYAFYTGGQRDSHVLDEQRSLGRRLKAALTQSDPYDVDAREFMLLRRNTSPATRDPHLAAPNTLRARLARGVVGHFTLREPQVDAQEKRQRSEPTMPAISEMPDGRLTEVRRLAERLLLLVTSMDAGRPGTKTPPKSARRRR